MVNYIFQTDQFGITDNEIHLLRSGFVYKKIPFSGVDQIRIERGHQIKNWPLVAVIGIAMTGFGLYTGVKVIYEYFFATNFYQIYIEQIALPVIPLLLGLYSVITAIRTGTVLRLSFSGFNMSFGLAGKKYRAGIPGLIDYLKGHPETRSKFSYEYEEYI